MKIDLNNIINSVIEALVNQPNAQELFSLETKELKDYILKLIEQNIISSEIANNIEYLTDMSAQDGFKKGFKSALTLTSTLLSSTKKHNSKNQSEKGVMFDDDFLMDLIYYNTDLDIYSDTTAERINNQEKMIYNLLPKEKAKKLSDYIYDTASNISTEGFEIGLHTGINLINYLRG